MKAMLMLEDGHVFTGEASGAKDERIGTVIFNTAVVGYQEMMTDPVNAGKILVLTYPLIGNYGIAPKFNESAGCWLQGLVIKERSRIYSNWQAKSSFDDFVKGQNSFVLSEVDTRTLAVHLRNKGELLGILSSQSTNPKELLPKLAAFRRNPAQESLLPKVSVHKPMVKGAEKAKYKIAILDLGITNSTLKQLEGLGLSMHIFPYNAKADEVLRVRPKGLIISNGPENDPGLKEVARNVQALIKKLPILGIGTGHQVLAVALGAKIEKMELGHHGVNYPVRNPRSVKASITVQNHSYCVEANSVNKIKEVNITGYNLNDRSIEEMESKKLRLLGVQYYPVSPGLGEPSDVFKRFLKMISKKT